MDVCVNGTYKICDYEEVELISDMQMSTDTFRITALGGSPLNPVRRLPQSTLFGR